MAADKITCPKCKFSFAIESVLTESIEAKVRGEFEDQLKQSESQWREKLAAKEGEIEGKLEAERKKLQLQAEKRAREDARAQLESLQGELSDKREKLAAAQKKELALLKQQGELVERTENLELEVQRKLAAERQKIQERAAAQAAEQHRLRDAEKDKQLGDMKKQIDELKRKAEQGSQQTQGEVLELDFEARLSEAFRADEVAPVAKGKRGGDVVHTVKTNARLVAGVILWEFKNTKAWSGTWLDKARQDQREAGAAAVVIVSEALPAGLKHFELVEGVWVCEPSSALALAAALRAGIIEVCAARATNQDRGTKMDQLYEYLSGLEFRQSVEAIVECFRTMQGELETEKRAMERIWAGRRKQLDRVIQSTAAMYGDLQGIIGAKVLPNVDQLELPEGEA